MFKKLNVFLRGSALLMSCSALILAGINSAAADNSRSYKRGYEVTLTNITKGQNFTPQLFTTHSRSVSLFELGQPASEDIATLAESGSTAPLTETLLALGHRVTEAQTNAALLGPGESVTIELEALPFTDRLSIAAMLIPTNDTFVAANGERLPRRGSKTFYLQAYDAGSEFNDQLCASIPGPPCFGAAISEPDATDEGFVYVSNGIHNLGDAEGLIGPLEYDWRNPVAKVVVKRVY